MTQRHCFEEYTTHGADDITGALIERYGAGSSGVLYSIEFEVRELCVASVSVIVCGDIGFIGKVRVMSEYRG